MAGRWSPLAIFLIAALAAACRPAQPPVNVTRFSVEPPNPSLLPQPRVLPWAADASTALIVDKRTHELRFFRNGELAKTYHVVLGRGDGRKLYEGDHRTPSGVYHIIGKRLHPRWRRFLLLDYPNSDDLGRYRIALAEGRVPGGSQGRQRGPGGQIGIHGTHMEDLNRVGIDWTYGCVSLGNDDVEELYDLVDVGTPVVILDDDIPPTSLQARGGPGAP